MTEQATILVVNDSEDVRFATTRVLEKGGYHVLEAASGEEGLAKTVQFRPNVVLLDVVLPDVEGTEVCRRIKSRPELRDVFVILASGERTSSEEQTDGLDIGADGYILLPMPRRELIGRVRSTLRIQQAEKALRQAHDELELRVRERTADLLESNRALEKEIAERRMAEEALRAALQEVRSLKERIEAENLYLRREVRDHIGSTEIVGDSDAIQKVLREAAKVAPTESVVLITGETGTGKELLAQAIHNMSSRRNRTMVKVNCAALPSPLIENELFGREKGAYTGALTQQPGRFEIADGSTLFLDEIGELPLDLQAKLLHVLQEGRFERLGGHRTLSVDVRVITASNRDLAKMVREEKFRADLYYRLSVFPIRMPPLRERREDIPLLVWRFVRQFAQKMGKPIDTIPRKTMDDLEQQPWCGNVRELRNIIERAVILTEGRVLRVDLGATEPPIDEEPVSLEEAERRHILRALDRTGWRISGDSGAAKLLRMKPTTLRSKMARLSITRPPR